MPINASEQIWFNGNLIPWNDAKLHGIDSIVNERTLSRNSCRAKLLPVVESLHQAQAHGQQALRPRRRSTSGSARRSRRYWCSRSNANMTSAPRRGDVIEQRPYARRVGREIRPIRHRNA